MFTYMKFEDGVKAIVNTDDIVDFDLRDVKFDKKYQVKWNDGHFYYGILGKMQQKAILEETKEAVDEKVNSKRVEFLPLSLCMSATEIDTESDLNHENSLKEDYIKNKVSAKIKKLDMEMAEKENMCNVTLSVSNGSNVVEKTEIFSKGVKKRSKQNVVKKPFIDKKSTDSSLKQSKVSTISKMDKKSDKQHKLKTSEAENCVHNDKNDSEFVSSCIVTSNKKSDHAQLQSTTNQDEALKKKVEKLRKTNADLGNKVLKLKNEIIDKQRVINDLMQLNMELQRKVIEEYPKLHQINEDIQIKVLSNFDELMYLISEYCKRNPMRHENRVADFPVGYRNIERNEIHLGYGVYICARQYDSVCVVSRTMPQFVKNLAIAVFGINTLKESSVTGARSNRNKNKVQETPRPALDSTKLQALRAAVKYYAMSEKGLDEVTADYEAQQIGNHISHKIYELNNPPNRNKTRHTMIVPTVMCEVVNNLDTDHNAPKDNSVPNDNSSASNSHSVTEATNNALEEHGPLIKTFSDKENNEEGSVDDSIHGISDTSRNSISDTD